VNTGSPFLAGTARESAPGCRPLFPIFQRRQPPVFLEKQTMADDAPGAPVEPYIGLIVAYHRGHDEGLGHAVRPAIVTSLGRSGEVLSVGLSVFLDDGQLARRRAVAAATAQPGAAGYWDFLQK
jgi:hypothetical protein